MRANFVGEAAESYRMASMRLVVDRMSEELDHYMRLPGLHSSNRSFVPLKNVSRFPRHCRRRPTYTLVSMSSSKHAGHSSHHGAS